MLRSGLFIFQMQAVSLTCFTLQLEQILFLICKSNVAWSHVLSGSKCITPVDISEFHDGLERSYVAFIPNIHLTL